MNILDRLPDYGERFGADGLPVDELGDVLMRLPSELGIDGVMLAGEIARHRCTGFSCLDQALRRWNSKMSPQ